MIPRYIRERDWTENPPDRFRGPRPKSMLATDKRGWWRPRRGEKIYVCYDYKWSRRRPGVVTNYCHATDTVWFIWRCFVSGRLVRGVATRKTDDRGKVCHRTDKCFGSSWGDAVWPKRVLDAYYEGDWDAVNRSVVNE